MKLIGNTDLYDKEKARPQEEIPRPQLEMKGVMKSPNCALNFKIEALTIEFDAYYSKAINYVVMVALVKLKN